MPDLYLQHPNNFSQKLDTRSRVTPNSNFEHELDDTSMLINDRNKQVDMREQNGTVADPPYYVKPKLEYLRKIAQLQEEQNKFPKAAVFPNGFYRNILNEQTLDFSRAEGLALALLRE